MNERKRQNRFLAAVCVLSLLMAGGWDLPVHAANTGASVSAIHEINQSPRYNQSVLVETKYGALKGFAKDEALHWYGVPYALAPVGSLRWKAPQHLHPWQDVLKATESKSATQIGKVNGKPTLLGSEAGAVTLDITRPDTAETNLPVLFYIHGGNNQTGKSAALPATALAKETNAVIVSINHRLGLLGFNALPALRHGTAEENSGNFGLLDIRAALEWVKENAEAFGGNPENITISGSSAGGRDVMAMLIAPSFAGKYQKAISFSGGMTTADPAASAHVEARHLAPLVVQKGLQPDEEAAVKWLETDNKAVRDFLYGLTDEEVAASFGGAAIRMSAFPHLFADGTVLPKEGFDTKTYYQVPILMVNGDREFSIFCKGSKPFNTLTSSQLMADTTLLPQYKFAEKYGSQMYGYFNGEESAVRMLDKYAAPIYTCLIHWGDDPKLCGEEYATIYGAYHCMTTSLMTHILTNAAMQYPALYASPSCKNVSALLNSYYKNFLWSGNPNGKDLNGKELPKWAPWKDLKGTTQLIVDADATRAWGKMSKEHTSYKAILDEMYADQSIDHQAKKIMIQTVLNGRWFSTALDARYQNKNLWE